MEYIIENEYLKVTVTDWGAQVKSVVRKCDGTEHMWQADPAVWGYHAPILFPYCGKLKDGYFTYEGKTYESPAQHGFARTSTHALRWHTPDRLILELQENEQTLAVFPFPFCLLSIFTLEGDTLHHTLTVKNLGPKPMNVGIGYHPAFSVPFDDKHTIADYELRFSETESPLCLATAPKGLVNGQVYSLGSNIDAIPVTDGMFDNDSHCMVNLKSQTLGLYEKDTGRAVVCDIADFPYTLIWSKPGRPQFICIEPWQSLPSYEFGSHAWEEKAAAATVAPHGVWSTTLKTRFVR